MEESCSEPYLIVAGATPSGPAAFLIFCFLRIKLTCCAVMVMGEGREEGVGVVEERADRSVV